MAEQATGELSSAAQSTANRVSKTGVVVKAAMDKTITVKVDRLVQHKLYKKIVRRSQKYLAHDEKGVANVGDTVKIKECRPISKRKNWRLVDIITKAK
jgi:small subunit ribosomal protein S17